jgi:hypothetical protein
LISLLVPRRLVGDIPGHWVHFPALLKFAMSRNPGAAVFGGFKRQSADGSPLMMRLRVGKVCWVSTPRARPLIMMSPRAERSQENFARITCSHASAEDFCHLLPEHCSSDVGLRASHGGES